MNREWMVSNEQNRHFLTSDVRGEKWTRSPWIRWKHTPACISVYNMYKYSWFFCMSCDVCITTMDEVVLWRECWGLIHAKWYPEISTKEVNDYPCRCIYIRVMQRFFLHKSQMWPCPFKCYYYINIGAIRHLKMGVFHLKLIFRFCSEYSEQCML